MVRNKKELEILLSRAPSFHTPSIKLEQYICDSSIASELIWLAYIRGDIENKVVADLGCGTGILSYGASILGARCVLCVDIDLEVLKIAKTFLREEPPVVNFMNSDVRYTQLRGIDTIIMNPPFGVHRKGIDVMFLRKALELKPKAVYTIHKYNPESHRVITEIVLSYDYNIDSVAVRVMRIPALYLTHRKRIHRFKVALYAITKR